MGEKDYFGPPIKIKKDLVFNQKDLYKHLKKTLKDYGYSVGESNYDEGVNSEGSKTISFSWECGKSASEYVKMSINLSFKAEFKDVKIKKDEEERKAQKGTVSIEVTSLLKKDPEGDWELNEKKPFAHFFKELYDKFFKKSHYDEISDELTSDLEKIIDEFKLFLKLRNYD